MKAEEIYNFMNDIEYGWIDKDGNINFQIDETYSDNYRLQSPKEVISNKVGVCWDQVELERDLFEKNNYYIKTYFLVYYDNNKCPTHTFLVYKTNNKYYWFEHSWSKYKGIHEYNTLKSLLKDVYYKFITDELNADYNKMNLVLREYKRPKYGITVQDFYKHCESGIMIDNLFD